MKPGAPFLYFPILERQGGDFSSLSGNQAFLGISLLMPWSLVRYQQAHCLHFVTFSCAGRKPLLGTTDSRRTFELCLEQVRQWYGMRVAGYESKSAVSQ